MSIWTQIKTMMSGQDAHGEPTGASTALHVIDLAGLAGGNGRERLSPRDQFALVKQAAAFAEKEKIRAVVLIEGRPLREVPDEGTYKTITVYYAENEQALMERALGLARGDALLITNNKKLEQQAQTDGIEVLRGQTLRKAMENGGGRSDNDKRGGSRGGRRRSRGRRSNSSNGRNTGSQDEKNSDKSSPTPPPKKEEKSNDGVSDLIDLV